MRRTDRKITEAEAFEILEKGEYGVLSLVDAGGRPYGVPMNFCVVGGNLYFHCANEGRKLDVLKANQRVSFCVVGDTCLLPDKFSTQYESCIVEGFAAVVEASENAEKQTALEGLVRKYSPEFVNEGLEYIEKLTSQTAVVRLVIESVSGKSRQ